MPIKGSNQVHTVPHLISHKKGLVMIAIQKHWDFLTSALGVVIAGTAIVLGLVLLSSCKHVNQSSRTKIIGGEEADTPLPVVGLLSMKDKHGVSVCTGTVVRHDLILTAAHCVEKSPDSVIVFRNFSQDSQLLGALPQSLRFVVFPGYDPALHFSMNADVAFLVFPPQTFAGSPKASFASKPVTKSERVALIGYGDTEIRDDDSNPQFKRFVGSNVVENVDPQYGDLILLSTSTVGMATSGLGQGDSGGSLFNAQGQIVGVAHVNIFDLPKERSHFNNQYISAANKLYSGYVNIFNPGIEEFIAAVMADQNHTQATVEKIKPTPIKAELEEVSDITCEGNSFCKGGWGWLKEGESSCSSSSPQWLADKKGCSCRCGK